MASWVLLAVLIPGFAGFAAISGACLALRPCVLDLRPAIPLANFCGWGGQGRRIALGCERLSLEALSKGPNAVYFLDTEEREESQPQEAGLSVS